MTYGERVLKSFTEQIEVKYLRALHKGWTDAAVIVDVKNQDNRRQDIADRRGVPSSEVSAMAGVVVSGDRQELARLLEGRFPGSPAAEALAKETPPDGDFPVIIITDADQPPGRVGIHFFYRPKPELPDEAW